MVESLNTPPKINMEPGNGGFPVGISFSKGPFSGSMFVLGGVPIRIINQNLYLQNGWKSPFPSMNKKML